MDNAEFFKGIAELNREADLNNCMLKFDGYFLDLAIFDHIHECQIIADEIKRFKNKTLEHDTLQESHLNFHLENELADLYILLRKKFENKKDVVEAREDRFIEKGGKSNV